MAQHVDWSEVEGFDLSKGESPLDLLGILWRRKWIVVCMMVIALALSVLYYLNAARVYRSVAQVLLIKREPGVSVSGSAEGHQATSASYENTLSTHMFLIRSPEIIRRALEKLGPMKSLKDATNPAQTIWNGLTPIRPGDRNSPDPNVMELWYEGTDQYECKRILEKVVQSYEDYTRDKYKDYSEETIHLITMAKDELEHKLAEQEKEYREFRQKSPLLFEGDKAMNLYETRMQAIEKSRSEVLVENAITKARLDSIQAAQQQGGNREASDDVGAKGAEGELEGGSTHAARRHGRSHVQDHVGGAGPVGRVWSRSPEGQRAAEEDGDAAGPDWPLCASRGNWERLSHRVPRIAAARVEGRGREAQRVGEALRAGAGRSQAVNVFAAQGRGTPQGDGPHAEGVRRGLQAAGRDRPDQGLPCRAHRDHRPSHAGDPGSSHAAEGLGGGRDRGVPAGLRPGLPGRRRRQELPQPGRNPPATRAARGRAHPDD